MKKSIAALVAILQKETQRLHIALTHAIQTTCNNNNKKGTSCF